MSGKEEEEEAAAGAGGVPQAVREQQARITQYLHKYRKHLTDVFCVLSRNKNDNLVCFRGVTASGGTAPPRLVDTSAFWIDADPEFVRRKAARGESSPVEALSFLERQLHLFRLDAVPRGRQGTEELVLTFRRFPQQQFLLQRDPRTGHLTFTTATPEGARVVVTRIHINEVWRGGIRPTVQEVLLFAWAPSSPQRRSVVLRVTPPRHGWGT